jgi:hypothetical protein
MCNEHYSMSVIRTIYPNGKPDSYRIDYPWGHAHNVHGKRSIIDLRVEDLTPNMVVEIISADLNNNYFAKTWEQFTSRVYKFDLPKLDADKYWVTGINKIKI